MTTPIRAIHNHIIFKFNDPVNSKGEFEEAAHESGIFLKGGYDKSAKKPRWATVTSVGDRCNTVKVGDTILIPALRWTEGAKIGDDRFWKTDEGQLVGVIRDGKLLLLNKHVTFEHKPETISTSASGLTIISHITHNTPHSAVIDIATDCEPGLHGSQILYNGDTLFDFFKQDGRDLAFIKEEDIIAYSVT